MAKKKKRKKPGVSENKRKKQILWLIGAIAVAAVVLLVSGNILFNGSGDKKGKSFDLRGSETRPVLEPSLFTGQVRAAYTAAKKYPEIMNQVFCYCFCDAPPFNHKTLLSCFTDRHAAG